MLSGEREGTANPCVRELADAIRASERGRRRSFREPIDRAADAYIVRRGQGHTIVAGYPWFTDWGRDTFVSVRGLCFATNRLAEARSILLEWADTVSEGMLPNRFPDEGDAPEFNAVDSSLWYVVAVHELLQLAKTRSDLLTANDRLRLQQSVLRILAGHSRGTRYGIRADTDGLLAAGVPGTQLTWMDARVNGSPITPRVGKPVEIQALWVNALWIGSRMDLAWTLPYDRARISFEARFWNDADRCLYDVIDVDHIHGVADTTFRPNQIFAVGGLPLTLLDVDRARQVVDAVERRLVTPAGLRSLAPGEPGYASSYEGSPAERDSAYHQGTVWPWLLGAFVEAWIRVRGATATARRDARRKFIEPLRASFESSGIGHLSEIADADAPHAWRGCPFQAWSLGEFLRLDRDVCTSVRQSTPRGLVQGHRSRTLHS